MQKNNKKGLIFINTYQSNLVFVIIAIMLAAVVCMVIGNIINSRDKFKVKKSKKKRVSSSQANRSMIGGKLAENFNENAKGESKYKIETRILNAGMNFTYGEYKIMCIALAIIVPLVVIIGIHNWYMAIVLSILSLFLPGQAIKYIANARITKMEGQVGSFMRLVMERYKSSKDMATAIMNTLPDFQDMEPFYHELKLTVVDINLGMPCAEALESLARRSGNKFMSRFANYYRISENLATFSSKVELLNQAYEQYQEDIELKRMLKKEISGPVGESYMMVVMTPVFMMWQSFQDPTYWDFMLNETMGQVGLTVIFVVLLACIVFINVKIGGPIE